MSDRPLFSNAVDWAEWARHAEPRTCKHCGTVFRPNHPRRVTCGGVGCKPRRRSQPRSKRPSGKQQAAARRAGMQGFVGEVLVAASMDAAGRPEMVLAATADWVKAEKRGDVLAARRALIQMTAAAAARSVTLVPPADAA